MENIHLFHDNEQIGPFTEEKIRRYLEEGRIQPTTLGWVEGEADWKPISEMLGLASIQSAPIQTPPPPPPPQNHQANPKNEVVSAAPQESEESTNWGQIIGGIFVAVIVGNLVFGKMCSSSSDKPTRVSEGSPSEAYEKESSVSLDDFSVTWITTARGLTAVDGRLWVPQVKTTVKNNGSSDLDNYVLRAVFLDEKGVITSESKEWIRDLPAGYAKGPFFIKGSVGYTSDMPFMGMVKDDTKKWRYDIFTSLSYTGPWKKIKSDYVPVPDEYQEMFKE